MKNILTLLRVHQWIKNMFVFLPIFFDRQIMHLHSLSEVCLVFAAFCMASSGVYCLNDIRDVELDRRHPVKCRRPLASGSVGVPTAYGLMVLMFAGAVVLCLVNPSPRRVLVGGIIAGYVVMNILYSMVLKRYPIIDTFIIAIGFVLRLICGGLIAYIPMSQWIVMMTFLLALFLAFAKRREDVMQYECTGVVQRKNIMRYNLTLINMIMTILSSVTIVCYIMYTISPEVTERLQCDYVYGTSIFVIAAIIRYHQLSIVDNLSGSPTKVLLRDRFTQLCIGGWLLTYVFILYL